MPDDDDDDWNYYYSSDPTDDDEPSDIGDAEETQAARASQPVVPVQYVQESHTVECERPGIFKMLAAAVVLGIIGAILESRDDRD